jgi:hypothetical protein
MSADGSEVGQLRESLLSHSFHAVRKLGKKLEGVKHGKLLRPGVVRISRSVETGLKLLCSIILREFECSFTE